MEKEYQLCLKEMNYEEKLKKLTEKFNQQMDSITKQNQVLKSEKEKQKRLKAITGRAAKELQDLESLELQLRSKRIKKNYEKKVQKLKDGQARALEDIMQVKLKEKELELGQVLKSEKEKQKRLKAITGRAAKELQDLESTNNRKLMLEYEKQQELQLKLQTMKEIFEEKVQKLKDGHVRALEDMTHFYEVKLQEKELELCQCQDASRQQLREFEEIKKQIEEDGDLELHDIRVTYERKLWEKKEDNLKLTGETRVMKKKFTSLQKEIDDRNLDIEKLKVEQQKQHGVIRALEKDIMGLQRKIQERDETIQEKENRFYGLKKKNEELEKFRFVLENEIDKLKKQIEPRENEVKKMKEQVHVMEAELKQFHKKSTHMELTVSQLKLMLKSMDKEKQKETMKVKDVKAVLHRVKTDLHNCVGFIQEPKKLKENIREIYRRYVHQSDVVEITGVDADVQREFIRQQDQMQRNMDSLRKKLAKDNKVHEAKNIKLIKENTSLIKENNDLRMEVKQLRAQIHHYEIQKGFNKNKSKSATYIKPTSPVAPRLKFEGVSENIIQQQRLEIQRLKQEILGQSQGQGRDQSFDLQTLSSNKLSALST